MSHDSYYDYHRGMSDYDDESNASSAILQQEMINYYNVMMEQRQLEDNAYNERNLIKHSFDFDYDYKQETFYLDHKGLINHARYEEHLSRQVGEVTIVPL